MQPNRNEFSLVNPQGKSQATITVPSGAIDYRGQDGKIYYADVTAQGKLIGNVDKIYKLPIGIQLLAKDFLQREKLIKPQQPNQH